MKVYNTSCDTLLQAPYLQPVNKNPKGIQHFLEFVNVSYPVINNNVYVYINNVYVIQQSTWFQTGLALPHVTGPSRAACPRPGHVRMSGEPIRSEGWTQPTTTHGVVSSCRWWCVDTHSLLGHFVCGGMRLSGAA